MLLYSWSQIQRIWYKNRNAVLDPTNHTIDVKGKQSEKCGRPKKYSPEDFAGIKEIPLLMRLCLLTVAEHIDIPLTSLWRYWKLGDVHKSTVHMKPALTLEHMQDRVEWCESFVRASGEYKDMYEYVHIDEKSFYLG